MMKKLLRKFIACSLALLMCLGSVAFAGAEETAIAVSATETTTIQTLDCTYSGGQNNGGNCQLFEGGYITATLDVAEAGYYTLDGKLQNRVGHYGIWDIYVNDMVTACDSFRVWGEAGTFFEGNVADIYLNKGINTVKFQPVKVGSNTVNVFFNEFSLTKKAIDTKAMWVYAEDASEIGGQSGKYGTSQGMAYLNRGGGGTPYPYAEYSITIPEGESGVYEISLQHTWHTAELSPYSVTVNEEDVSVTALPGVPRTNTGAQYANTQYVSPMCQAFLNDGANTIRITNKDADGQLLYLSRVKVDKVKSVTEISATETTTINTVDCTNYAFTTSYGNGNIAYEPAGYTQAQIYVPETGYYSLDVSARTRGGYSEQWDVYVDDLTNPYDFFEVWISETVNFNGNVMDVYLTKGVHTLRIKRHGTGSGYHFLDNFSLTKKAYDSKAIWFRGDNTTFDLSIANYATQMAGKIQLDNASNVFDYVIYNVTIPDGEAGTYKMTLQNHWNTGALSNYVVEVNNISVSPLTPLKAITTRGNYADEATQSPSCEFSLKEGANTIKITNKDSGGQTTVISRVKLDKISSEVSYDQRFHAKDYVEAYASQNTDNTAQLKYDGNPDNTIFNSGNWAKYNVTIDQPGWYDVGLTMGARSADIQDILFYVDGEKAMRGTYISDTTDYSPKKDAVFGSIYFAEAKTYELKIERAAGNWAYYSHVFLNHLGADAPLKEIPAEGTTKIAARDYLIGYDKSEEANVITVEGVRTQTGTTENFGGNLSFGVGDYVEYYLDIEKAGIYKLAVLAACESSANSSYDISVNGEVQLRQVAEDNGFDNFINNYNYIKLDAGKQVLRVDNVGHPNFYFQSLALTYAGDFITATTADTSVLPFIAEDITSDVFEEIALGVYAENAGVYRLNLSTIYSAAGSKIAIYDNEGLLALAELKTDEEELAENTVFVNLNEGYNVLTIKALGELPVYSDITIAMQTASNEDALNAIIADVEATSTADELREIIAENETALGIDFNALTDDIQYSEYVLIRLLNRSYMNITDFYGALYDAIDIETASPSLTSSLSDDGTLTVNASTDIYEEDGTFIVAVYSGKRMKGINYIPYAKGETKTLTVTDCSADYAVKFFAFNEIDKMQPITVANGVYANIYVATNGNDAQAGTKEAPFKTLARAKEEVASLRDSMTGDIVVNIEPGYYELSETEVFDETHGGVNNYKVIYKGTDETQPSIIGGGKKVEGWTDADNDGIYEASFAGTDVRDLYVNGYPATRARSEMFELTGRNGKVITANIGSHTFAKPTELVTVWLNEWANHYIPVEAISKSGSVASITLSDLVNYKADADVINIFEVEKNEGSADNKGWCAWHNEYHKSFFIENALELLNEEGEFYYDKSKGKIYYKPYSEENLATAEVYASQVESLIEVSGANDIAFDNLGFRYSTWNNNEIYAVQANQYISSYENNVKTFAEIPSQITFNNADNVEIKNCEFACLGSNALALYDAVTNAKISGNIFRDLSGGAVVIGSFNHEHEAADGDTCVNIEISDNVTRRTSLVWRGMPVITAYYEKDIDIVRNDISYTSYSGLSLGWGWGHTTAKFGNFTVSNNSISEVMQSVSDGGHIYTLGDMPGTVISNNYLYHSPDGRGGIYNDSGSGNINILNNVVDVYNNYTSYWWFQGVYLTHDLHAEGNFAHSQNGIQWRDDAVNNTEVNNNHIASAGSWNGAGNATAQAIVDNAGVGSEYEALIAKASLPTWRD